MTYRLLSIVTSALSLAAFTACSDSDPASDGETPTTTTATTLADSAPPTTTPVTTAPEVGATISRDSALAANKCLELWASAQLSGRSGFIYETDLDELAEACGDAQAQLDLDKIGVPSGHSPVNSLALVIATIAVEVSFASTGFVLAGGCEPSDGACLIDSADQESFLQLDDSPTVSLIPAGFLGYLGLGPTPTIELIDGIVIAS